MDEAIARIQALLAGQREEVAFERCLPAVKADDPIRELKVRSAVASSLVAVLELARLGEVTATQAKWDARVLLRVPT